MEQIKGRIIQGSDNKENVLQEFFDNNSRLRCPECGCLLDPYYRPLRIDFKSKFDFSSTYEGIYIVNKRFKDYIQSEGYDNVIFFPVNEKNDFFYFHVLNNIIIINKEKSGIVYKEKCETCHYPKSITGGFKIFIQQHKPLSDGFYTTDLYWRTNYIFSPLILIGLDTYHKLKEQKFKGLDMVAKVF